MTTRTARNEGANAEILGVVILIGIFAITAGIISATTLATPEAQKVPAASIEITGSSGAIRIAHLGGDPLPPDCIVRGTRSGGGTDTFTLDDWLDNLPDGQPLTNGFSEVADDAWIAAVVVWTGSGGETSVIAIWDPNGIYGPLGPSVPSGGDVPGIKTTKPTQPVWPTPTTAINATLHTLSANFTPERTAVGAWEPVQFTDTSTWTVPITNWSWNFGDGYVSTQQHPQHTYNYTGNYTVSLTISNLSTGVSSTMVKQGCVNVTDMPSPVAFTVSPTLWSRVLTVTCTDQSQSSPTLWRWTFTETLNPANNTVIGPTTNGGPQTFTFYNPTGLINNTCHIKLEIWSPYFQSPIELTKTVIVAPPLHADFRTNLTLPWVGVAPSTGIPIAFEDTTAGAPDAWAWDFENDGVIDSTEQNPVHTFMVGPNEIKTFTVRLTAGGWGQTSTVTHIITIYPAVVSRFDANITEGMPPLTVQFTDQSTGFPTNWLWTFVNNDGSQETSTEQSPVHTFTKEGVYDVTLFAERRTTPDSADEYTSRFYIRVGANVTADFTATPDPASGFAPLFVQFWDHSWSESPTDPVDTWAWDFGDGNTSTVQNATHTYEKPGTYAVTLTASNNNRYDTLTKVGLVKVYGRIAASFTANQTKGLVPLAIRFADTSTGNPTAWAWEFGDGATSTERDPVHIYNAPGTYTVNLTASHALDSNRISRVGYIVASEPPVWQLGANETAGPANLTVQFTDTSPGSPIAWAWEFGDGTSSIERNPIHTFGKNGTYTVNLTVTNSDSTVYTSLPVTITVFDPITARLSALNTDGEVPLFVFFTDLSTGGADRRIWEFDDPDTTETSIDPNPVHEYKTGGIFTATLTVWNSLRPDLTYTDSATITAYGIPNAAFTHNITLGMGPAPLAVKFTDQSTGNPTYRIWDFNNDGSIDSSEINPTYVFTQSGNYTVKLRAGNPAGEDPTPANMTIAVYETPVASFTSNVTSGLRPLTVQFTDNSTGNPFEWLWDFGDGTSTDKNPIHTFATSGNYTVKLTVSNPALPGGASTSRTIGVFDLPVTNFTASTLNGAAPLTVQFTDTTTGDGITSRLWTFGDGGISTEQNPVYTYAVPGTYTVNLTVTNPAGSVPKTDSITVTTPAGAQGLTSAFSANITSGSAPFIVQFTNESIGDGITGWLWAFGDGSISTAQDPVHTYTAAGTYNVSLTVTNATGSGYGFKTGYITVTEPAGGNAAAFTASVNGPAAPTAAFSADPASGVAPLTVRFTDESTGNPTGWAWDFNDDGTVDTTEQNPECIYTGADTFSVRLTVTNADGSDDEVKIDYITVI